MARKDLLAEAIADAKAVKETALANAKLALEEAFTPKLQSMISAKLAEEMDDDTDEAYHEEEMEEGGHLPTEEMDDETEEGYHEMAHDEDMEEGHGADEGMHDETEEGYHEMAHDEDMEEGMHDDMEEEMDDLDLEEIIKELEMEGAHEDETEEAYHEMAHEEDEDEDDEELDLDEVINALKEMAHEDELEEMGHEKEEGMHDELEEELEEAYNTIESLQATINEVNLLNAKLLYTNKLFRTFDLNESQKVKVLENFDRTSSVREVKLVFTTLAENLNVAKNKKTVVKEGYASKTIKSSAPKKEIITEVNSMASRWKKLAGLK